MSFRPVGPLAAAAARISLSKKGKTSLLFFLFTACLPPLVYALFAFDMVKSKSRFNEDLEVPVALVQTARGTGSAFLYGEKELYTARHVLAGMQTGDEVTLLFQNASPSVSTTALISWMDADTTYTPDQIGFYVHDMARLELNRPTDLPEDFPRMVLGSAGGVTDRSEVLLIGYPNGSPGITAGIISNTDVQGEERLFQLDVQAYPGSSGGPLVLKETEEVIGILIAGQTGQFQGINYAVKVE